MAVEPTLIREQQDVITHPELPGDRIVIRDDEFVPVIAGTYTPERFARLVRLMEGALSYWKQRKEVEDAGAEPQEG